MQLPVSKPLVMITGPTAVGKTQLSLEIVGSLNGEIISADSRLFYKELDIGTAKPSRNERKVVQHHLIDIADPDETLSLSVFQQSVYSICEKLWGEKKVPFLVGGTGQFIRAIMEGWVIPPQYPNKEMRGILELWGREIGPENLHDKLRLLDPKAAEKMDARNLRRIIRALEVILSTGKMFSDQRKKQKLGFKFKVIGLTRDREELYQRVDERIVQMFENGFVDEVRALLDQGYHPELPALSAIGYKEVIDYLQGNILMDEVVLLMKRRTRSYIRRQANWFKLKDERIKWFEMHDGVGQEVLDYIISKDGWKNG